MYVNGRITGHLFDMAQFIEDDGTSDFDAGFCIWFMNDDGLELNFETKHIDGMVKVVLKNCVNDEEIVLGDLMRFTVKDCVYDDNGEEVIAGWFKVMIGGVEHVAQFDLNGRIEFAEVAVDGDML